MRIIHNGLNESIYYNFYFSHFLGFVSFCQFWSWPFLFYLCVCVCSTEILRDVSFTVDGGQTVALVSFPLFNTTTFWLYIKSYFMDHYDQIQNDIFSHLQYLWYLDSGGRSTQIYCLSKSSRTETGLFNDVCTGWSIWIREKLHPASIVQILRPSEWQHPHWRSGHLKGDHTLTHKTQQRRVRQE